MFYISLILIFALSIIFSSNIVNVFGKIESKVFNIALKSVEVKKQRVICLAGCFFILTN